MLWWRLRPAGIRFQTHVTENGRLIQGGDLEERTNRITRAMRQFERMGKIQCALSAIIFLVWFVSFWIIRRALAGFTDYI